MKLKSDLTFDKLTENWDVFTSPSRFAGSDDFLDDIFIGKRKKNKVFLSRKPRGVHDLFNTVFRGKLVSTPDGLSAITGFFTVGTADYIITSIFAAIYIYMVYVLNERSEVSDTTQNVLLILLGAALVFAFLVPKSSKKKKIKEFLIKIAEKD